MTSVWLWRRAQISSHRPLASWHRRVTMPAAPCSDQRIPESLSRCPTDALQPASTAPDPTKWPSSRNRGIVRKLSPAAASTCKSRVLPALMSTFCSAASGPPPSGELRGCPSRTDPLPVSDTVPLSDTETPTRPTTRNNATPTLMPAPLTHRGPVYLLHPGLARRECTLPHDPGYGQLDRLAPVIRRRSTSGGADRRERAVNAIVVWLRGLSPLARWAIVGATSLGIIGAIVGLVIGLRVHAPTAPFAAVELGLPAAIVGGVIGLAAGVIVTAARRIKGHDAHSS
jgi:hypothetical protein